MKILLTLLTAAFLMNTPNLTAAEVSAAILSQGSSSWDGGGFSYPEGAAQLTVQKINVKAGPESLELGFHCHTVPLAAYVTAGSVKVVKLNGEEKTFKAGEGLIEVVNRWHKGVFVEDSELIVFYAGVEGMALSFKKDAKGGQQLSCQ